MTAATVHRRARAIAWEIGRPVRFVLVIAIRAYRLTLAGVMGGRCRFHPSCSEYAERAIADLGVMRGVPLAVWRLIRCTPLSAGGIDYPPARPVQYDAVTRDGRAAA